MQQTLTRFLTERDVSNLTKLGIQTLRNHRSKGKGIPYHKIGRSVRYAEEDVARFMEQHRVDTTGGVA